MAKTIYGTKQAVRKARNDYNATVKSIRQDDDLTPDAKKRMINEAYQAFTKLQRSAHQQISDMEAETQADIERLTFKVDAKSPADHLAFDEAVYRFRQEKPSELKARLKGASPTTAKAIAKASYLSGRADVLEEYGQQFNAQDDVKLLRDYMPEPQQTDQQPIDWDFMKPIKPAEVD